VGGGIFRPSGSDADVAKTSPAVQLAAALGLRQHFGLEAEFLYVPIQLKDDAMPASALSKSSQIAVMAGIRFSSDRLLDAAGPVVGYASARCGFARIVTSSDTQLYDGEWIGRTADELTNPGFGNYPTESVHKGFVLSPRAGVLVRLSRRAAVDISAYPVFIFAQGDITRQVYVTASFALAAWQDL
jgi:hypothetical protein